MSDLQQVVALIKAGNKAEAREILVGILRVDRDNEKAWLYMASCAANKKELTASIRHVLRLNPQNQTALKMAQRYQIDLPEAPGKRTAEQSVTAWMEQEQALRTKQQQAAPQKPAPAPELEEEPRRSRTPLCIGIAFMVFTLVGVVALVAFVALSSGDDDDGELSDSAQTATSISATNEFIQEQTFGTATAAAQTLSPNNDGELSDNAQTATSIGATNSVIEEQLFRTATAEASTRSPD